MTTAESVFVYAGDDEMAVSQEARAKVAGLTGGTDLGLDVFNGRADDVAMAGETVGRTLLAIQSPNLFCETRVIWLKDANFLGDSALGRNDSVRERLSRLGELIKAGLPPRTFLVVSATDLDRRTSFAKACEEHGTLILRVVPEKERDALAFAQSCLGEALKRLGLRFSPDAQTCFLDRVAKDRRQIANEVEKLALFAHPRTAITRGDVEAITSHSAETLRWGLLDAIGERQLPAALTLLERLLAQKEEPTALTAALEGRLRELAFYRDALDRQWLHARGRDFAWASLPPDLDLLFSSGAGRDPRQAHPFVIGKLARQAGLYSTGELQRALDRVADLYERLLSGAGDRALWLELLLIELVPPAAAQKRR